ncbi:MAG TPA: glycosyltransferase family 2 protein [Patescibacteria group bacterium]|nr:glycosyltransferase family 2 protein [Patescibacteria group bacterium]
MIGVVVPAYNAEATIGEVARGALKHLSRVLVVDDGSHDATAQRAAAAGARVTRHPANRGKGAALRTGFAQMLELGAEAIITMDADLQHEPDDIPRLVETYRQLRAELIIGSRRMDFTSMTRGRRFGNRFSCGALRFFTGLDIPDSQSGYRLYEAGFVKQLELRRDAYDAEMEVLLAAARGKRRVETIDITSRAVDGTPTSYYRPWLDTYRICRTVVMDSICRF